MQSRVFFNATIEETSVFFSYFSSQVQNSLIFNNINSSSCILITLCLVKKSKHISGQGPFRGGSEVGVRGHTYGVQ